MKNVVCCIFVVLGYPLIAENVIFAWDPNPPHEKVQTYVLYERVGSDFFVITSTPGTNLVVKDVAPGHHCYALKARNAWGESLFSNEVCVDVDDGSVNPNEDFFPPVSAVLALPIESYASFDVSWQGRDEAMGSGVASYDVYVSVNEGPFQLWLNATPETNAVFHGDLGAVYSFFSVATDRAGNREPPAESPDAVTWINRVNRPPELEPVPTIYLNVGEILILTNRALDSDLPAQDLRYALCSDFMSGARIDPMTGVFVWKPGPEDAGTTNQLCVSVFDSGSPNLANTHEIEVVVDHYLDIRFEDFAVLDGETGRVPLSIYTSMPIRDLFFTLSLPPEMQANVSFSVEPGKACQHYLVPAANGTWFFMIRSCDGKPFFQTETLGELSFTAQSAESRFISMQPVEFTARLLDERYLNHVEARRSKGAIIKDTPLLELLLTGAKAPELVVYGRPGNTYVVEQSVTGGPADDWQPWLQLTLTNIVQNIGSVGSGKVNYFRVREAVAAIPYK